jgi:hypothetical protein
MTGKAKSGETRADRDNGGKDIRAERLASALRANLRRRKQQARVRAAAKSAAPESEN